MIFHARTKIKPCPVTLHSETENISITKLTVSSSNSTCTITSGKVEISFFNCIDEYIIQTVIKELKEKRSDWCKIL